MRPAACDVSQRSPALTDRGPTPAAPPRRGVFVAKLIGIALGTIIALAPLRPAQAVPCECPIIGDCAPPEPDCEITSADLQIVKDIQIDSRLLSQCPGVDRNGDGRVDSAEVALVENALRDGAHYHGPFYGFGNNCGGTGLPVVKVTSTADSTAAGTLRAALAEGNRIVRIDVSGVIKLSTGL